MENGVVVMFFVAVMGAIADIIVLFQPHSPQHDLAVRGLLLGIGLAIGGYLYSNTRREGFKSLLSLLLGFGCFVEIIFFFILLAGGTGNE